MTMNLKTDTQDHFVVTKTEIQNRCLHAITQSTGDEISSLIITNSPELGLALCEPCR